MWRVAPMVRIDERAPAGPVPDGREAAAEVDPVADPDDVLDRPVGGEGRQGLVRQRVGGLGEEQQREEARDQEEARAHSRASLPASAPAVKAAGPIAGCVSVCDMSAKRGIGSRQTWAVAAWIVLAALALTGIALNDVSIMLGAGGATLSALRFGFFPASAAGRP